MSEVIGEYEQENLMKTIELKIEGMTCSHCIMHVKSELSKLAHVQVDDVQIGKARVRYDEDISEYHTTMAQILHHCLSVSAKVFSILRFLDAIVAFEISILSAILKG